jgi:hypothetical protein
MTKLRKYEINYLINGCLCQQVYLYKYKLCQQESMLGNEVLEAFWIKNKICMKNVIRILLLAKLPSTLKCCYANLCLIPVLGSQ